MNIVKCPCCSTNLEIECSGTVLDVTEKKAWTHYTHNDWPIAACFQRLTGEQAATIASIDVTCPQCLENMEKYPI